MNVHLSPGVVLGTAGALLALLQIWRASVRRARRLATAGRTSARLTTLSGRVMLAAGLLGGTQWMLIAHPANPALTVVAVGLPDVVAAFVLVRSVTVTTVDEPQRGARRASRERGARR